MNNIGIIGCGKYLPEKILTNEDFVKMGLDTTNDWIVERTGIHTRHIVDENTTTSDLAAKAAEAAIANAKIDLEEIDLIIVGTSSPDYIGFPSVACLVQKKLGIKNCAAFDVTAACTGFSLALTTAVQYMKGGLAKKALVIGAETFSRYLDFTDRSTCILFGDGAGAVVLGEVAEGYGILSCELHADGNNEDILRIEGTCGSQRNMAELHIKTERPLIYMNGRAVFKAAMNVIVPCVYHALGKVDMEPKDLDWLIPHQANWRLIDFLRQKLNMQEDQVVINVHKYGNTSGATIPIALAEIAEEEKLQDGQIIALAGFGGGFTWGVNIIKWGGNYA